MKEYKCKICGKRFSSLDNLKKFIVFCKNKKEKFYDKKTGFVICNDDLKIIMEELNEISYDIEKYKEHYGWLQKEKKLLSIAKEIYKKCDCRDKKVDLNKINDEVYDLMCEKCWDKFRQEEAKLKKQFIFPDEGR